MLERNQIILILVIGLSLLELVKSAETGYDLVLMSLTIIVLSLGWSHFGYGAAGAIVGFVLYTIVSISIRLFRRSKSPVKLAK